jgi:Cathepsin propeptide inhibitor domain (I29)
MKYSILLFAFLLAGVVNCFTESEYKEAFAQWQQARQKAYSADEFHKRFAIFKDNMDFVKTWNEDPTHTHTGSYFMEEKKKIIYLPSNLCVVALNDFADLSNEEYQGIYLGTRFDGTERLANAGPFINITVFFFIHSTIRLRFNCEFRNPWMMLSIGRLRVLSFL